MGRGASPVAGRGGSPKIARTKPGPRSGAPRPPAPRELEGEEDDPELEALVREIIDRVADKWTMLAIEVLAEHGRLRFTRLGELIGGVSQKMLTKTLRQMEADGLVVRKVYPVVPPKVEYALTSLGESLGEAFCGVWIWAAKNRAAILRAREASKSKRSRPTA